ncbi:MAG: energy-coupling factor transporter transmembrane protein EcfT [Anaerolineaceae bacterium]
MNNFEFLRYVNIGQFLPTGSWIHHLDARSRIICSVLLVGAFTFSTSGIGLLIGLAAVLLLLAVGRIPLGFALKGLEAPMPFLAVIAVLQVFFNSVNHAGAVLVQFGPVIISTLDLWAGGLLVLRFVVLILGLGLMSFTLSTSELIHGLDSLLSPLRKIGLPTHDLVLMVQVTLRFLPYLAQAAEKIAKAQASRGAEWGTRNGGLLSRVRQVIPLLVPLFLISLRKAENLALAMDARGYTGENRSSMFESKFRPADGLAIVLSLLASAAVILL